jgi:hypothetical protein
MVPVISGIALIVLHLMTAGISTLCVGIGLSLLVLVSTLCDRIVLRTQLHNLQNGKLHIIQVGDGDDKFSVAFGNGYMAIHSLQGKLVVHQIDPQKITQKVIDDICSSASEPEEVSKIHFFYHTLRKTLKA